jgi:very-short-patch-repair endonuclease
MLPSVLLGAFTSEQAAEVGMGLKALARLRKAGLAVSQEGVLRLVEPVQPALVALAAVGPPVALCAVSAAGHYGWSLPTEPGRIHLVVPPRRCPAAFEGVALHRWSLARGDLVTVGGTRVTEPVRTALDVASLEPLTESLPMLDALLRAETLEREQLEDAITLLPKGRGSVRAGVAVGLANGRRASSPESVFFALVHAARLPRPVSQFPIRKDGRLLGIADFAWPLHRLVVEIDGYAYHSDKTAFVRDRRRQNDLVVEGWRVLRFAALDVTSRPEAVIAAVRVALGC